jgi:hypothetical protein
MPAVLLDANAYRSIGPARFDVLLELERQRQVARYAEPFAVMELLTHLANPQDPAFAQCRAAVVRIYRRCVGGEPCGIIRDSESRLAEAITGKGLEKHDAHTDQLTLIVMHVGEGRPLSDIERQLRAIAAHVTDVEARFAGGTMRRLQTTVGALLADEEPEERRKTRKGARETLASEVQRRRIAERLLRYECHEAGIALPEPPPDELVARVLKGAAAGIEFEAQLLGKAAFDGVNVEATKIRNLRWDQRIAFNIGQTLGGRRLWLVTNDGEFAKAAEATGYGDRVHTLAAYEQWLGQEAQVT